MLPQIQGASALATPPKQDGLIGIYDTLTTMRKGHFAPVAYIDLYCGSGTNHVDDEIINGSPLSMLEGIKLAIGRMDRRGATSLRRQPSVRVYAADKTAEKAGRFQLPGQLLGWNNNRHTEADGCGRVDI